MKLVKLTIEIIYETLQLYKTDIIEENLSDLHTFCKMFKCSIKILIRTNFKMDDLVQKTLHTLTHYKEIINVLYESRGALNLTDVEGKIFPYICRLFQNGFLISVESLERLLSEDLEITETDVNSEKFKIEQF